MYNSKSKNVPVGRKAIKYPLYPTKDQEELFAKTFGCVRLVWNSMLADSTEYYLATDKFAIPSPAKYKKEFPFLKEVDSLALCNVEVNLNKAFKSFFKKKNRRPKFKSKKKSKNSYTTNNQNGTVSIVENGIILPKFKTPIKANIFRKPGDTWKIKSATITKTATGKYFCSVLFEYPIEPVIPVVPTKETTLGLDYSSPCFYVDSNGNEANYDRYYRASEQKLARAQRRLSKKQKGSKNYEKQKHKVALINEKIANQRYNFCHKESRKKANSYNAVCVEDINLKNMARSLKLGKSTNDNGFGMFRNMLKYKLEELGKHYIVIDKWYPSSKTCHNCGYINKELQLKDRTWVCKGCGSVVQRDHNAALNIRDVGLITFFAAQEAKPA